MKKNLLITLIIVALTGCSSPTDGAERSEVLTQQKDGVEVAILEVQEEAGVTSVVFEADNHVYDFSISDIGGRSSLDGQSPKSFEVIDSAMGGHHIGGKLIFDTVNGKSLELGLTDEISFVFKL